MLIRVTLLLFLLFGSGFSLSSSGADTVVGEKIDLLSRTELTDWSWHLQAERSLVDQAEAVWSFAENGSLHLSGKGWGYLRTKDLHRDYHLVLEFRWGERTWGAREDKARASGLFVHGHGEDAGFKDAWMQSI